jgi:cytochrome subunit of sulfide dehydrogenase
MRSKPWLIGGLLACGLIAGPAAADPAPLAAEGCFGCHGPRGQGIGAGARLAGRDAAELETILRAYRDDQRQGTIMNRIARGYTEAELAAVSAFFAGLR